MWWQVGTVGNVIVAALYAGIALVIARPLVQTKQFGTNRLGTATFAIFSTCAIGHAAHALHMYELSHVQSQEVLNGLFDWHMAILDFITAGIAIWYWNLRKTYGSLMHGAKLFEDLKEKQKQALEINDNIVQGLTVAKLALEVGDQDGSEKALESSLASARQIITELIGETDPFAPTDERRLRRREAATL